MDKYGDSFSLDPAANDTSLALDFLRACAAQMVCVGHAVNIFLQGVTTYVPHVGVMLFFILSGFVIAQTLVKKSKNPDYGFAEFAIERTARVYSAYLPALIMIAAIDWVMYGLGRFDDVASLAGSIFVSNLFMLQNYPGPFDLGVPTFGSAGQLSSLAAEFHIYLFIGSIFFMLRGRARIWMLIVAVLTAAMPLGYFLGVSGTDRGLFVLWLLGYGVYFVACATKMDKTSGVLAMLAFPLLAAYWWFHRSVGREYDVENYPVLSIAFLVFVLMTQSSRRLSSTRFIQKIIRYFADYAFSLFLVHYTLLRVMKSYWSDSGMVGLVAAIVIVNIFGFVFFWFTERKYREVAWRLKHFLLFQSKQKKSVFVKSNIYQGMDGRRSSCTFLVDWFDRFVC